MAGGQRPRVASTGGHQLRKQSMNAFAHTHTRNRIHEAPAAQALHRGCRRYGTTVEFESVRVLEGF